MTPKTKKIIVREGLMFLFLVVGGAYSLYLSWSYGLSSALRYFVNPYASPDSSYNIKSLIFHRVGWCVLILYIIYIFIRFVIWAMRRAKRHSAEA